MAEQKVPQEITKFQAGLITDANPLTFPQGAATQIENIIIDRNGDIHRRLGLDFEINSQDITTSVVSTGDFITRGFKWENAGGSFNKSLLVVQIGNEVKIFNLDATPISSGLLYTYKFTTIATTQLISFSVIDSFLVAADGTGDISVFEYEPVGATISRTEQRILVRDFWGVDDIVSTVDLREGQNIIKRPATNPDTHLYNLRNQSFGVGRPTDANDSETLKDPIVVFQAAATVYPSNSDDVNFALYPDSTKTHSQIPRFWPDDLHKNKIGTFEAGRGYFIIDILNRGTSRLAVEAANRVDNTELSLSVTTLPTDSTAGGATVTAEFAGRAFFAGFGTTTTDGDAKSPKLASYVAFSRLVRDVSDIKNCYQIADPTSGTDSELVATDGGTIRIDGAYNIQALIPSGSGLLVLAQNGVWRIVGGSDFGFGAVNFKVDRISDDGCRSAASIVYVDGSVVYWGDDGIYTATTNEVGDWSTVNLVNDKIQRFYNLISTDSKAQAAGMFDHFERKIRWVYNTSMIDASDSKELIYDVDLSNFSSNIFSPTATNFPNVADITKVNPFAANQEITNITVGGVQVVVSGVDVVVTQQVQDSVSRESLYVVITEVTPFISYTFSKFSNTQFRDWVSFDSVGIDAPAVIVTGQLNSGENSRRKKNKNLMLHMKRTESGVTTDVNNQIVPANQSSILVQAHWDWAISANSNRWSTPRQYYKPKRGYLPANINDEYDTGFDTVITKDLLRGHGKALNLKFTSEPDRDMHIHGWTMVWGIGDKLG